MMLYATRSLRFCALTFIIRIIIDKFPIVFQFFLIQSKRIVFLFQRLELLKYLVSYLKARQLYVQNL